MKIYKGFNKNYLSTRKNIKPFMSVEEVWFWYCKCQISRNKDGYCNTKTDDEFTKIPNKNLFDGIESFQKKNNLKPDRIMNPDGETENTVNKSNFTKHIFGEIKNTINNKDITNIKKNIFPKNSNKNSVVFNSIRIAREAKKSAGNIRGKGYNDKYKHSKISCDAAQNGVIGDMTVGAMGAAKEYKQVYIDKDNTPCEAINDWKADLYGIKSGLLNPYGDCDEMVQKRYKKYKK